MAMRIEVRPERKARKELREVPESEVLRVKVEIVGDQDGSRRDNRRESRVAEAVERVKMSAARLGSDWLCGLVLVFVMNELDIRAGEESESVAEPEDSEEDTSEGADSDCESELSDA